MALRHTEDFCLDRHQLDVICSEEGHPVAPSEWDVSAEHGLRIALSDNDAKLQAAEGLAAATVAFITMADGSMETSAYEKAVSDARQALAAWQEPQ